MTVAGERMNQADFAAGTAGPSGLGGWLILPAIGLFLTPVRILTYLGRDLLPLFQDGSWEMLTTPGSEFYHHLWAPLIVFEIVGNLSFAIFAVVLIFLFFGKSHRFPALMIAFLLANLAFILSDLLLVGFIPGLGEAVDAEIYGEIARGVVGAAIWVPYFLVSKRVKNTFVKPG